MELDILLRGQSNAYLLAADTQQAIAQEVQQLLGFDGTTNKVSLLFDWWTQGSTSIVGSSAFLGDWMQKDASGQWQPQADEQALLTFASQHRGATETAVLWLHNETDSANPGLTTADWTSAVRADAALVRQALGQDAAHAPYMFVSAIPYDQANDASNQAIRVGMEQLAADPAFHAGIAARAQDLDMSYRFPFEWWGDNTYGRSHISWDDAQLLVDRIAHSLAQEWAGYAQPGSPVAQAGGNIDDLGPQVTSAKLVAADILAVTFAPDQAAGLQPLDAAAAGGIGWSVHGASGTVTADQASITGPDSLQLHFGGALPADGQLFYGYGSGRLADWNQPGHGNAVYDSAGLPAWAPATGVPIAQNNTAAAAPDLSGGAGPVVTRLYDTVFGRLPDLAGLNAWTGAIVSGQQSLGQVASAFVGSAEFQAKYGALNDHDFVSTLYVNALHRQPDAAGLASWTDALAHGASRSDVVLGVSESPEHVSNTAASIHGDYSVVSA